MIVAMLAATLMRPEPVSRSEQRPAMTEAPLDFAALAECESGDDPTTDTGNGFYGLYQFDVTTWQAVGGSGLPSQAPAAEQTYRARLLYAERGDAPWPTCGWHLYDRRAA